MYCDIIKLSHLNLITNENVIKKKLHVDETAETQGKTSILKKKNREKTPDRNASTSRR